MKKVLSMTIAALLVGGTMAVYAGASCGGCGGKKADKEKDAEKTEQASTADKAEKSA
jgi:hypothetical protein